MISIAFFRASPSGDEMLTVPSSLMSILAPVWSVIALIIFPPGPMITRIWSGLTFRVSIRGAYFESSGRGAGITSFIFSRMCKRPSRAWVNASCMISCFKPAILMSI